MKKASKPASQPKRKARGQFEVAEVVARLDGIADKLAQAVDCLVELVTPIEMRREEVIVESIAPEESADVANEMGEE